MKAHITTLSELSEYAQGQIVQLPDFAEGQPFFARIKRPSLIDMAKNGQIPNALLSSANTLFTQGKASQKDDEALSKLYDILDLVCEACFVEPTYDEIKASGIKLTDEQYMFIFNYTQTGVNALETFRKKQINNQSAGNITKVSSKAVRSNGNK